MFRTCREVLQQISKVGFHEPATDYRKAFETLDHKVLLFKLRKYGLESTARIFIFTRTFQLR